MKKLFLLFFLFTSILSFPQTPGIFSKLDVTNRLKINTIPVLIAQPAYVLADSAGIVKKYMFPGTYWTRIGNYLYPTTITDSVGIGTTTPCVALDVNGSINISTTTSTVGQIKQGGNTILHTYFISQPNLFIGIGSGNYSLTGGQGLNTAVGYYTLNGLTSGVMNTAIGNNSLSYNTSGQINTAVGSLSMLNNTTGSYNVGIGRDALLNNVGNNYSTAIGYGAMGNADNRITGRTTYNTAIGYEAMKGSSTAANNTGQYNTAVGYRALDAMTSGGNNTALGMWSLTENTTGNRNVAIGSCAQVNGSMSDNVAIGYDAFDNANDGKSVGIGSYAGTGASGGNNIIIGYEAGKENAGNNLTIVGYQAGFTGDGDSSIFIGNKAGYNETGSNKLYIENSNADTTGALIFGNFATNKVKVNGTLVSGTGTIANNDATPDVTGGNIFIYNGTANSVTLTDLDNPTVGAVYTIIGNSDTYVLTINDTGNFHLSGTWEAHIDDAITVYCKADNYYVEISRSHH